MVYKRLKNFFYFLPLIRGHWGKRDRIFDIARQRKTILRKNMKDRVIDVVPEHVYVKSFGSKLTRKLEKNKMDA